MGAKRNSFESGFDIELRIILSVAFVLIFRGEYSKAREKGPLPMAKAGIAIRVEPTFFNS